MSEAELLALIQGVQQLVPQEWCLSCRGCCRFADTRGAQAPVFSPIEVRWALQAGARPDWFQPSTEPPSYDVGLASSGCGYRCPAFAPATNRCQMYAVRPLDCRMYPFVLTRDLSRQRLLLAVDTKCPYIQQLGPAEALRDYGWYLGRLLESQSGQALLADNPALGGRPRDEFWTIHPLNDPVPPPLRPSPTGFHPLGARLAAFEAALERAGRPLSAYHCAAWLPWQDLVRLWWGSVGTHPCVVAEQAGGYFLPLPPLGSRLTSDVVAQAFALLHDLNGGAAVSRIENVPSTMIAIFHEWGYESRLVEQEYLYNRLTLARRYESGARQTFRTSLAARMYHPTDAEQCLRLYTLWALRRQAAVSDLQARAMLRDGFYVHRRWLEGASALGIRGFVVEAAGEIQGYTLGVDLSAEVFVIIAEVTNVEFQGVASRLTWELCRVVDQPWINGMGDAGLETLARAKAADCPQRVLPVYAVTPRLPGPAVRSGSKSRAGERGGC